MLRSSASSWNRGDLDGFLEGYLDSDSTTFVTGSGLIHGVDAIRQRYRTGYWSTGRPADQLRFEDLQVRPLGRRHALATGRYVLFDATTGATTGTGFFSLVLVRTATGWKIIHDHSSSAS